jgi:hypothetical protein
MKSGRREIRFYLRTDASTQDDVQLALTAEVVPAIELKGDSPDQSALRLAPREVGRRKMSVITRQAGDEGFDAPGTVRASGSLDARFRDEPTTVLQSGRLIEKKRTLDVTIEPRDTPGTYREELNFGWPDGRSHAFTIVWRVTNVIAVNPTGITLDRKFGESVKLVVLTAHSAAFRILGAKGALLKSKVAPSAEYRKVHLVRLNLDPNLVASAVSDIDILTDRPEQPTVRLSVLLLSSTKDKNE